MKRVLATLVIALLLASAGQALALDRQKLVGQSWRSFSTKKKLVALTFDDGPSRYTRRYVKTLRDYRARGTFFWIGSRIDTATARYVAASGNEIGNHGWGHTPLYGLDATAAASEIVRVDEELASMTGRTPFWLRSPQNSIDETGTRVASETAHAVAYWSVNPKDYLGSHSAAYTTKYVLARVKPGAIIELHENERTAVALPKILKGLKARGYRAVTLSELAAASNWARVRPVYAP
jgi:peptidoglycan-N-acetylglucosamine deacetylase